MYNINFIYSRLLSKIKNEDHGIWNPGTTAYIHKVACECGRQSLVVKHLCTYMFGKQKYPYMVTFNE